MQACDFHNTAKLLKDCKEEEHIRTSISRSYYGAYLYFREFLAKNGLVKRKKRQDPHAFVHRCLQFCEVEEGVKAAVRLNNLFEWRNDADYKLVRPFSNKDSNDRLKDAQETIADFKSAVNRQKTQVIIKMATAHAEQKGWV